MPFEKNKSTFAEEREELRRWPYSIHSVEESLDADLIEGRGKQLLFQALNQRNAVAFVGSGVSLAFGRLSWKDWLSRQLDLVKRVAGDFVACVDAAQNLIDHTDALMSVLAPRRNKRLELRLPVVGAPGPTRRVRYTLDTDQWTLLQRFFAIKKHELTFRKAEVSALLETLKSLEDPYPVGSDPLPITFQVADQLQDVLLANQELFLKKTDKTDEALRGIKDAWFGFSSTAKVSPAAPKLIASVHELPKAMLRLVEAGVSTELLTPESVTSLEDRYAIAWARFHRAFSTYEGTTSVPESQMSLGEMAKTLLVDEVAHVEAMLWRSVQYGSGVGRQPWSEVRARWKSALGTEARKTAKAQQALNDKLRHGGLASSRDNLRRDVKGIRQYPGRYAALSYFKTEALQRLIGEVRKAFPEADSAGWADLISTIGKALDGNKESAGSRRGVVRTFVSPTHRFVFEMLTCLVDDPLALPLSLGDDTSIPIKIERTDFESRTSIIDPDVDPLETIIMRLGISRFLTTNYDFEIERFYQDRGYQKFPEVDASSAARDGVRQRAPDSHRMDALGGVFKDQSFRRNRAIDLVRFAIDFEGADAHVMHLHGSAARDDVTVITERDYMQLYLRQDRHRDTVNEAIRLGFSANPLVFLGLGMTEADVLRPLRQFMSDRDRTVSRTAIVFFPGVSSPDVQRKLAATLYLRYGAHTIHYGRARVLSRADEHKPAKDREPAQVEWLFLIGKVVSGLEQICFTAMLARTAVLRACLGEETSQNEARVLQQLKDGEGAELLDTASARLAAVDANVGKDGTRSLLATLLGAPDLAIETLRAMTPADWSNLRVPNFPTSSGTSQDAEKGISAESHLKVECAMLSALLRAIVEDDLLPAKRLAQMARRKADKRTADLLRREIRILNARLVGLKGLREAIITGTMCASLQAIEAEWQHWWRHWQLSPPHREATFELREVGVDLEDRIFVPLRYVRHRIDNVINNLDAIDVSNPERRSHEVLPGGNRQRPGPFTRVRSFDGFLDALEQRAPILRGGGVPTGRCWLCVAGHRGVGRGTFFSAFETRTGLGQFLEASWAGTTDALRPQYLSAIFVNLSFATEVASTFDMLVDALLDACAMVDALKRKGGNGTDPLGGLDLRRRVAELHQYIKDKRARKDIELGRLTEAYEVAREGLAGELHDVARLRKLRVLFKRLEDMPEGRRFWQDGVQPRILICISGLDLLHHPGSLPKNREIEDILAFLASPDLALAPLDLVTITGEANPGEIVVRVSPFLKRFKRAGGKVHADKGENTLRYVHLVRNDLEERAKQHVERRRERSGIVVEELDAAAPPDKVPAPIDPRNTCFVHFAQVVSPEQLLIDNFLPLAGILFLHNKYRADKTGADTLGPEESRLIMKNFRVEFGRNTLKAAWSKGDIKACHVANGRLRIRRQKRVVRQLYKHMGRGPNVLAALLDRYQATDNADHREWKDIRTVLGSNRYCLTIIMAATQRIALSGQTVAEAGEYAEHFIRKVVDRVRAVSSTDREETILHDVLDAYEAFHKAGQPHDDIELHLLILRHLAVIGAPCSADVLVQAPAILDYFDAMPEGQERSRHLRLVQALTAMAERGLVFRLHPNPKLVRYYEQLSEDARNEELGRFDSKYSYRYALHRLTQKHIIRKMGSGPREFVEINNYAPTLYASMPADLPRLSHEAHLFLQRLVDSLAQYPDRRGSDAASASWHFGEAPLATRVQALRAAMSTVRSAFSIGVVSRFEDYESHDPDSGVPARGHFEAYRVQVRWLIRKAWELLKVKPDPLTYDPAVEAGHIQAFYRDEIVWLYNECGVVALVQGNLNEASAMLRQAMRFNRSIEGNSDGGPQHNRISLNLAITQIERGRLGPALKRLEDICQAEARRRKGRVWHIAYGYSGLIHHLQGNHEEAVTRYKKAIEVLKVYDDSRSVSIFSRHYGDLERYNAKLDHSPERVGKAGQLIDDAIGFAQAGGHEDLHKRARLSRVQLDIHARKSSDFSIEAALGQIRLIEEYAETMEMPSLICDVLVVRARLLLSQGESTLAGSLLARAMAITRRNGMSLRLTVAATAYARVLAKRQMKDQANELLFACLEIAKRGNNQMQIAQVEAVFDEMHRSA